MIKVTIWNEYQEERQYEHVAKVYPKGIHGALCDFLSQNSDMEVKCVTLDMKDQGLSEEILEILGSICDNSIYTYQNQICNRIHNNARRT